MKRLLLLAMSAGGLILAVVTPHRAEAVTCTVTFTDGSVLEAMQLNGLPSCINNIDRANVDAYGIDASQIKPTTTRAATFGGTVPYTFPVAVIGNAAAPVPHALPSMGFYGPYVVAQNVPNYLPTMQPGSIGVQYVQANNLAAVQSGGEESLDMLNPDEFVGGTLLNLGNIYFGSGTAHETDGTIFGDAYGPHARAPGVLLCLETISASDQRSEEAECLSEGHAEFNGSTLDMGVTATPATCAALATCGQIAYRFARPFLGLDGVTLQSPICTGAIIQDTTTPSDMWIASINAVSGASVTLNYAPLTTTSATKNIDATISCWIRKI